MKDSADKFSHLKTRVMEWVNSAMTFKYKQYVLIASASILCVFLFFAITGHFQTSIREQQLTSVNSYSIKNKQISKLNQTELAKQMKQQETQVIAMIDASDNPSLAEWQSVLDKKDGLNEIDVPIYLYQPIYNEKTEKKTYDLKDKNTFIIMEKGQETSRFSYNKLTGGTDELNKELLTRLNPKIAQKEPVRVEPKQEIVDQDKEKTSTSEVFFE